MAYSPHTKRPSASHNPRGGRSNNSPPNLAAPQRNAPVESSNGTGEQILTDYAYNNLKAQWEASRHYHTICSNKHTALVFANQDSQRYTVDLATNSCTGMDFQDILIPCCHAIAAIRELKYAANDFVHEAYFTSKYKALYEAPFTPIDMENLLDDSDCEACNIQSRRGRIAKIRKHTNQSRSPKRANTCSICKGTGHTKRSQLCSGYKPESFFHTRPGIDRARNSSNN